jgi:hypothetical protein
VGDAPGLADVFAALVVAVVVAFVVVEDPPHPVSPMAKAATNTAPRRLRVPMRNIVSGADRRSRADRDYACGPKTFMPGRHCAAGATHRPGNTYRRM